MDIQPDTFLCSTKGKLDSLVDVDADCVVVVIDVVDSVDVAVASSATKFYVREGVY